MREFTQPQARALPVIVLADVSGSMAQDGKIEALNQSVREMVATFGTEDDARTILQVCVVTFGGEVRVHTPLQPAAAVNWSDMQADGSTPMGGAMSLAADLIDDDSRVPSRSFRPVVILVSDGIPTDDWRQGLTRLTREGRAQKADRLALAIGGDANEEMLEEFLADPAKRVFRAEDARKIRSFFRFATMSITARSRSANPNLVPPVGDPFSLDQF